MPNIFQQFLNQVGSGYKEADKRLGGWLPGGGTASPVTARFQRALAEPRSQLLPAAKPFTRIAGANPLSPAINSKTGQITPEASEMLRQMGISTTVTQNINETNPIAILGQHLGYIGAAHANPLKNQIYLPGGMNNLTVLAHEAGHLDKKRRADNRPIFEGILGQAIDTPATLIKKITGGEFSPLAQPLAPFRLAGGLATALSDAKEEDYAERFAEDATKSMLGEAVAHMPGDPKGGFLYPKLLYQRGRESFSEGVQDLLNPPIAKAAGNAVQFMQNQIQEALPKPPSLFEDVPNLRLQQMAIEADLDYRQELKENPNSLLLPRLQKIKEDYARATKARGLN
jgi:hypothetical protein